MPLCVSQALILGYCIYGCAPPVRIGWQNTQALCDYWRKNFEKPPEKPDICFRSFLVQTSWCACCISWALLWISSGLLEVFCFEKRRKLYSFCWNLFFFFFFNYTILVLPAFHSFHAAHADVDHSCLPGKTIMLWTV